MPVFLARSNGEVYKKGKGQFVMHIETGMNPISYMGCRDGKVVGALASHQCGLDSIPRSGVSSLPSPQKPKFVLIVLIIVNFCYSVPN